MRLKDKHFFTSCNFLVSENICTIKSRGIVSLNISLLTNCTIILQLANISLDSIAIIQYIINLLCDSCNAAFNKSTANSPNTVKETGSVTAVVDGLCMYK